MLFIVTQMRNFGVTYLVYETMNTNVLIVK